jgi:hypothetical protein
MELIVLLRKLIAVVALAFLVPTASRADSLVLGEYLPKAQAMLNGIYSGQTYYSTVEYTATSATTGHLLAKANAYIFTDVLSNMSLQASGSSTANFTIDVDLTNVGGNIGFVSNSVNNKLSIKDGSSTLQFFSSKLVAFEFTTGGQFKFKWEKDGGVAALASPIPYIGAIIYPQASVPSSFKSGNSSFGPILANTDVFMTPAPEAGIGGMALLSGLGGFSLLRRRACRSNN